MSNYIINRLFFPVFSEVCKNDSGDYIIKYTRYNSGTQCIENENGTGVLENKLLDIRKLYEVSKTTSALTPWKVFILFSEIEV